MLRKHKYLEPKKIGEGSFGKAILVEGEDGTSLICKVVDVSSASPKEAQDAIKEGRLLAAFRHPYIVRYRESFIENGLLCIVMDYCSGGDLSKKIEKAKKRVKFIPEEQVLKWFTQAMLALKYIHDMHVLHRDLKSSNFFLSSNGNLKMGDFGIAKVLSCTAACARTQIGTPYYLSPEVCREQEYTWPSDIWAMGCILYEMCALRVPFDARDISSLVQKICNENPPLAPLQVYSDFIRCLCLEMLRSNPSSRPNAESILQRQRLCDIKKLLLDEAQAAQEHLGPYADTAGTYRKNDNVEYYSKTHKDWLPATVINADGSGRIIIDLKPNTWISKELQAHQVRLLKRGIEQSRPCPTPMRQRSPSSGPPAAHGLRSNTPNSVATHGKRDVSPNRGVRSPMPNRFSPRFLNNRDAISHGGGIQQRNGEPASALGTPQARPSGMPRIPGSPLLRRCVAANAAGAAIVSA